jgi:glycosyltransferase involved in cell wall biosynthesis
MSCGCPVLTTKVGGIPTVVREGEGLFVDVGNIRAMVDCMIAMLDGKHQLDMEKASRETRRRFSYPAVGLLLHQVHLAATFKQHS